MLQYPRNFGTFLTCEFSLFKIAVNCISICQLHEAVKLSQGSRCQYLIQEFNSPRTIYWPHARKVSKEVLPTEDKLPGSP